MIAYFDNSATTKVDSDVVEAMIEMMTDNYGNPSSINSMGVRAEKRVKESRKTFSNIFKVDQKSIVFTSGGTEGNNLYIQGLANKVNRKKYNHIITSVIEHPAVYNTVKYLEEKHGFDATYLEVDETGRISLQELKESLREDTFLVSIMHVNNEVGSIQKVEEIVKICRGYNPSIKVHSDGVQAFGKLSLSDSENYSYNLKKLAIDAYTVSGHKINGPKGTGVLYVKNTSDILPLLYGGSQEDGIRPGTENVPGVIGLGIAASKLSNDKVKSIRRVRDYFYNKLSEELGEKIKFNSEISDEYVSHILNVTFVGLRGEVLIHQLETKDIYGSTGSACSSKDKKYSRILHEMGISDEDKEGAIRFSFGHENTLEQVDYAVEEIKKAVDFLDSIIKRR